MTGKARTRVALVALALAAAIAGYVLAARRGGDDDERHRDRTFVAAERSRAVAYAAEFARSCAPPCSVHRVEPIASGVWRVHLNFETGYCVLVHLDEFRRTSRGTHEGWEHTDCVGPPRRQG